MKKLILTALCVATLGAISACSSSTTLNEDANIIKKFRTDTLLLSKPFVKIKNHQPDGLLLYRDSLLLIRNFSNTSKFHFSVFNLNTGTFTGEVLGAGRYPGQAMGFLSYGIYGDTLWVSDIVKEKIIRLNLDSAIPHKSFTPIETPMPVFYYGTQLLSNDRLLGTGNYDDDYKFTEFDLAKSKIERQRIAYDDTVNSTQKTSRVKKMAYESLLFLKPDRTKSISAGRYSDYIEIYDIKSGLSKIIKGPENFEPEVVIMKGNDGKELAARGPDTRYAFVKGKTTEKYIYLLYSGNLHNGEHLFYGKAIFVYDWEGKAVAQLKLPAYILDFVVTSNNKVLYSYDPKSKYITISHLML
jgi:TolB-like 6-blade propeller-like